LAAAEDPAVCRRLVLFDPVILPRDHVVPAEGSPLVDGTRRRRVVFPNREAAVESYRGRGAFTTWPDAMLADYVAAGFRDLPGGEVALICRPEWEASGFLAHGHDPWAAFESVSCPVDIFRAETDSTFHLGAPASLAAPNIHISTVAGSTHFLPMERPDLIRSALTQAIDVRSRATTPARA
jgi:pimeloyl-ACP methyl ester carboxylesterase